MRLGLWSALVLSGGCVVAFSGYQHHQREVATVERQVSSVDLVVSSGDVTVAVDPSASSTSIARTTRWNADEPCTSSSYTDGAVSLGDTCQSSGCAVDYDIVLPASAALAITGGSGNATVTGVDDAVALEIGSGDIVVKDVGADLTASTGSGDMDLTSIAGTLDLSTGSGDIRGSTLTSATTAATTGSGDVALTFEAPIESVRVVTGSGDVTLVVPAGTYDIEANTASGDVLLQGDVAQGDGPLLSVEADSGTISIIGQ